MKKLSVVLILSFLASSIFAFSVDVSADYSLILPQKSSVISATGTLVHDLGEDLYVGSYLGLGYSYRYFNEGGSEAQLYGPALKLGILTGYSLDGLTMELSAGAKAIYSQFPTVLWLSAGINTSYEIMDGVDVTLYLGGLFWGEDISYETGIGVRF